MGTKSVDMGKLLISVYLSQIYVRIQCRRVKA